MAINEKRKIAFIFLPAGGQKPGMGRFLNEYGKEPFEIAGYFLGVNLKKICTEKSEKELNSAPNANVATFAQSFSTFELLLERGIKPDVVTGYSVGMYPALCAAQVYDFGKGINYLYKHSVRYQKEFPEGKYGMALALSVDINQLANACKAVREEGNEVYVSNFNAPGLYLIAGKKSAFPKVKEKLGGHDGIIVTRVNVPSHSPLVRKIEKDSLKAINDFFAEAKEPKIPVVSTVTGDFVTKLEDIKRDMRIHISSPVQWEKSVYSMFDYGINTFIELGPSTGLYKIITGLGKTKNKKIEVYNTTDKDALEQVLSNC